jgi:hypothetical protein
LYHVEKLYLAKYWLNSLYPLHALYFAVGDSLRSYTPDKRTEILNQLKKDENLSSEVEITKGNYSIIMLPENFIPDEKFLTILRKNKLPLNESIQCSVRIGDGSTTWISENNGIRIKNELEKNENVLQVFILNFDY